MLSGGSEKPATHSYYPLPRVHGVEGTNSVCSSDWKSRSQMAHPRLSKAMGRGCWGEGCCSVKLGTES